MSKTKEWVEDGVKDKAENLQRGFLVITNDAKLDTKTGSVTNDTTVHTVLFGKQEVIDVLQPECEKFNKGSWKNQTQVRAM